MVELAQHTETVSNQVQPDSSKLPLLQLAGVWKSFGSFHAVQGIDLNIQEGEFLTIVGPSGSGKTTLLRMLAGMEIPDQGMISLRGVNINHVPPNRRPTCLVFQSLALFPHKSVGENIEFPLKVRGVSLEARRKRTLELMALVHLPEHYFHKNVMRCSGGEKQRVALARALAFDPEVLLFDEPLSAIDFKLRKVLEKELKDIHQATGKTFIYITHSLEEAMVMSDRIAVMKSGRLVQIGSPKAIYEQPVNRFVAEFMGEVNIFPIVRRDSHWYSPELDSQIVIPSRYHFKADQLNLVLRPEYLRFVSTHDQPSNRLVGYIHSEYMLGSRVQYQVRVRDQNLLIEVPRTKSISWQGSSAVTIGWDANDAILVEE